MKKCKTFKAILAIILAMQIIIAMIPIGIPAAGAPVFEEFSVGNIKATIDNKTITAKVFTSDINENKLQVYFSVDVVNFSVRYEGESLTNGGMMDLTKFMYGSGLYKTDLLLRDTATNLTSMYNLIVEVVYASGDTSIASIDLTGSVGAISADYENQLITGAVLYGIDLSTYTENDFQIVLTDANRAGWEWNAASKEIIVTAENGNKTAYSFQLTPIDGLSAFTISEASSSVIDQRSKTITIEMPYTHENDIPTGALKATASFTKTIPASTVSLGNGVLLNSSNKVDWIEAVNAEVPIIVSFIKNNVQYTDTYMLTITYPLNPNAKIKEVEIVSSSNSVHEPGIINNDVITAQLAKGASLENATVCVKASVNSKIRIPMQGIEKVALSETDFTELPNVNLQGSVAIQVISEDEKIITRYTLNVTGRSNFTEPNILSLALKDSKGNVYYGEIIDNVITIKGLAYNTTTPELADMSLVYTVSNGAVLLDRNGNAATRSGTKLGGNIGLYIPDSVHTTSTASLSVLAQDEDNRQAKSYHIAIEANPAKEESHINNISIMLSAAGTKNEESITGQIATEKDTSGIAKNVAVFTMPFDTYYGHDYISINDQLKTAKPALELSDGAVVYYYDAVNKLFVLMQKGSEASKGFTFNFENANSFKTANIVYVLSEEVAYRIAKYMGDANVLANDFETFLSSFASSKYTRYYVYAVSSAARKGTDMNSLSIDHAKVSIDHSYQLIQLTIPWSQASSDISSPITLIPNFTLSGGAGLWADVNGTKGNGLKFTSGGIYDSNGNWVKSSVHLAVTRDTAGNFQALYYYDGSEYVLTDGLYVVNEGGTAFKKYSFQIGISIPESGSSFSSFSLAGVNGNISGTNISVILPYGTDVKALVPEFSVSKMASVFEHIYGGSIASGENEIDFTNRVRLTVYSEDRKNKTIYTISVTVADAFIDVRTTDWFYTEVMQAAAAGLVNGVGNGYFKPNNTITRADFAVMVARMLNADLNSVTLNPFTDVSSTAYFYKAIVYGYEAGYLGGYENGSFKPYKTITRQEMAKMLATALKLDYEQSTEVFSDDKKIAAWAKNYVYACKSAGIMEGTNNIFSPANTATRAQAAAVIVRSREAA